MEPSASDPQFYVVVLGAGGVGKSCLTVRYVRGTYEENYDPTIEEAYEKMLMINEKLSRVSVVDTAGAEQFHAVVSDIYLKPGRAYILAFALDSYESLRALEPIYKQLKNYESAERQRSNKKFRSPLAIVGTKCDLVKERTVTADVMEKQAKSWGLPYFETSAKENIGISAPFKHLVAQLAASQPDLMRARSKPESKPQSNRERHPKKKHKKGDSKCVVM